MCGPDDGERARYERRTVVYMATALKGRVQGGGTGADPGSNTPFFEDVPCVFAVFVKNKQNARDIR